MNKKLLFIVALLSCFIGSLQAQLPGLLHRFTFDNTYANTSNTISFASNSGTSFTTDRNNNPTGALRINQTGSTATIANLPYGNSARTIAFWARIDAFPSNPFNFFYVYGTSANPNGVYFNSNSITHFGSTSHNHQITTVNSGWVHHVFTYDGAKSKLYRNGVLISSRTISLLTVNNNDLFRLGLTENGAPALNASIDDLEIYNRALSANEIYNMLGSKPTLPVVAWDFRGTTMSTNGLFYFSTPTGTNLSSDRFNLPNNALSLNNSGSVGDASYFPTGNNTRTISFWFKRSQNVFQELFVYGSSGNASCFGMYITANGSFVNYYTNNGSVYAAMSSSQDQPIAPDTWHFITVVYTQDSSIIYRNGLPIAQSSNSVDLVTTFTNLRLGMVLTTTQNPFQGSIDDIKVYNAALSAAEIADNYNRESIAPILPPTITSFTPLTGKPGDIITITGSNFNTNAANNVVFFGSTKAIVNSATSTSLSVTVPIGAAFSPIAVLNSSTNLLANSMVDFIPTQSRVRSEIFARDFPNNQSFNAGANPRSIAVGDIDGDGKPDIVIANTNSNTISIFRNTSTSGIINNSSFATRVDFTTSLSPRSVALGDLDGDGKLDVVVTNSGSNSVSVFRNASSNGIINTNSLETRVDFTTGTNPHRVAIGDIDGDGKLDLVVANFSTNNSISVFRNTATSGSITTNSFDAQVNFATGSQPIGVAIGDLNGDGKPDVVVTNASNNTISLFRNTASIGVIDNNSFTSRTDFTTPTSPESVAIGDLDGDGKPDIVVATSTSNAVSVFRNTTTAGFFNGGSLAARVDFLVGSVIGTVTISDINGDGKPDLITANSNSNAISVFRNIATSGSFNTSSFATRLDIPTQASGSPFAAAISDFDGDGRPDLAVVNSGLFTISIHRNLERAPTITSFTPINAKPGDDVVLNGTDFNNISPNNTVFFGATRATVTAANDTSLTVTVPSGATYSPITVLNADTKFIGFSNANFAPVFSPAKTILTTNDFLTKVDFASGNNAANTAIGDLDGDGKPDLVVVNGNGSSISVFRNISNTGSIDASSFSAKVDFTTGSGPRSVAIGDLDGDGKPEMVVVNSGSNTISVFRNTTTSGTISGSSFAARVDFTAGTNPIFVTLGDVDGDGKSDIIFANTGNNTLSILRNVTVSGVINTASFAARVNFTTGNGPYSVAVGDLDGDGKPDIAVTNYTGNTISIFRNTSTMGSITTSSLAAKVDFTTGLTPYSIAIGDLNSDGKPDLAVANYSSNTISIFRNTSISGSITTSSFAVNVNFATATNPISVAIGDLNGDGKPDLAVANNGSNLVSIIQNNLGVGNITSNFFNTNVDFTTGSQPNGVAIGDIDGDGKPDLITANWGSGNVSILRNADISLPIVLKEFTVKKQDNHALLKWVTKAEINAEKFDIEKGLNATSFSKIATVMAKGYAANYSIVDNQFSTVPDVVFYRLKMVDKDGSFTYSNVVKLQSNGVVGIELYPNPVKNQLSISYQFSGREEAVIRISTIEGKVVQTQKMVLEQQGNVGVDVSRLTPGAYIVEVITGNNRTVKQVIKE